MTLVTPTEFRQELREHERVNVVITGSFPDGLQSYKEKYPKPLLDTSNVAALTARISSLVTPGKWIMTKANGDRINNRRSTLQHIRFKE